MRCGIIDIGSNSIRLCVYECAEDGSFTDIFRRRSMAGLAAHIEDGKLSAQGIRKTCETLTDFCQQMADYHPDHTGIFATASLRKVSNQEEVIRAVKDAVGIAPEIISGEEEARFDFLGATRACPVKRGILADIGGGSTELIWYRENGPVQMVSLPVGSLALHTAFVRGLVPTAGELEAMRQTLRARLAEIDWPLEPDDCQTVCGIGGTMRMTLLLARELLHTDPDSLIFTPEQGDKILDIASNEDQSVSKTAYAILPERFFSMVPGLLIVSELHRKFQNTSFYVSTAGAREGYLIDRFLNRRQTQKGS